MFCCICSIVFLPSSISCFLMAAPVAAVVAISTPHPASAAIAKTRMSCFMVCLQCGQRNPNRRAGLSRSTQRRVSWSFPVSPKRLHPLQGADPVIHAPLECDAFDPPALAFHERTLRRNAYLFHPRLARRRLDLRDQLGKLPFELRGRNQQRRVENDKQKSKIPNLTARQCGACQQTQRLNGQSQAKAFMPAE